MYRRSVLSAAALAVSALATASPLYAHELTPPATPSVHSDMNASTLSHVEDATSDHRTPTFVALNDWSARVQKALDHNLQYTPQLGPVTSPGTGVVWIKFNCSESGRPDKISLSRSSGDGMLDREAMRAMSRVATLHPLPTGFNHGQRFEAMVVFASDPFDARLKTMAAEQTRRNAWYHDPVQQAKGGAAGGRTAVALADAH
jgi:protein TonB